MHFLWECKWSDEWEKSLNRVNNQKKTPVVITMAEPRSRLRRRLPRLRRRPRWILAACLLSISSSLLSPPSAAAAAPDGDRRGNKGSGQHHTLRYDGDVNIGKGMWIERKMVWRKKGGGEFGEPKVVGSI